MSEKDTLVGWGDVSPEELAHAESLLGSESLEKNISHVLATFSLIKDFNECFGLRGLANDKLGEHDHVVDHEIKRVGHVNEKFRLMERWLPGLLNFGLGFKLNTHSTVEYSSGCKQETFKVNFFIDDNSKFQAWLNSLREAPPKNFKEVVEIFDLIFTDLLDQLEWDYRDNEADEYLPLIQSLPSMAEMLCFTNQEYNVRNIHLINRLDFLVDAIKGGYLDLYLETGRLFFFENNMGENRIRQWQQTELNSFKANWQKVFDILFRIRGRLGTFESQRQERGLSNFLNTIEVQVEAEFNDDSMKRIYKDILRQFHDGYYKFYVK